MTNDTVLSHSPQTKQVAKELKNSKAIGFQILGVTAFLSLGFLLDGNMGGNEIDVLPLSKQYADPSWMPGDWYLNQLPSYRWLFFLLFGGLVVKWGFLITSILGRLLCYALIASGLVAISRKLGLNFLLLLLAVGLFLYVDDHQGVVAREWLVGGFEPKSIAYGLVLLGIGSMLTKRDRLMAFLLGLATSFHVLVGGWAFLAGLGWLLLRRTTALKNIRYLGSILLLYLAASGLAFRAIWEHLFAPITPSVTQASFLYVFLRLPHHLYPLYWSSDWWIKPLIYLLVLALCTGALWFKQRTQTFSEQHIARMSLVEYTLLALVPFVIGLAIAPFDSQGRLLQYYPFRLGDILLPLTTCLLVACVLQEIFTKRARRLLLFVCMVLLSWVCTTKAVTFQQQVSTLSQFPAQQQHIDPEWLDLCTWIRSNTPKDSVVVSPPADFPYFTWLSERPTIVNFKLLPQGKVGILEWYERLSDLSGELDLVSLVKRERVTYSKIRRVLETGYNSLTTAQVREILAKYRADYLVTQLDHPLDLPIAYRNSRYILYANSSS
ncbi:MULTISPECIES: DUF6798 domain-containing protein [unclassified Coleofasciculus]|uniref:DUF6798 domain-containing protein n=1 Tax=unclassified Coleofasciculus TaxID=2692782 RepID=UPI0018818433|nr:MULTISPECIES: DUF6798 domain-containing protein [unclassified Coleofasciculus]MBE9129699.1 hypothetical protein [Coleofasciculus sp. LEGE 07081]MBE9149548.1 hypothetical protein [Coleofasciculus sp. LEGE 07092]